jgi:hypothetical protein
MDDKIMLLLHHILLALCPCSDVTCCFYCTTLQALLRAMEGKIMLLPFPHAAAAAVS